MYWKQFWLVRSGNQARMEMFVWQSQKGTHVSTQDQRICAAVRMDV